MFDPYVVGWFVVAALCVLLELAVPGLIIIFFGVGALVTGTVVAVADVGLATQISIFTVSSLVSLFALRRWLKSVFKGSTIDRDGSELADDFSGKIGTVTKSIEPQSPGEISALGTLWAAKASVAIAEGAEVRITQQKPR